FVRAGEGYFSPDGSRIIFQAEEKGSNPFYQEFVMELEGRTVRRVSPGVGKTTCGFFSPDGKKIIFASSHLDPDAKKHYAAEYQQREEEKRTGKRRRYQWDFDPYMDIYEANLDGTGLRRLTHSPGYDAEGSYSPDGKQIVFTAADHSNPTVRPNYDVWWMNIETGKKVRLTYAPGQDVLPAFRADGSKLMWTSTRDGRQPAQLYMADFVPPAKE